MDWGIVNGNGELYALWVDVSKWGYVFVGDYGVVGYFSGTFGWDGGLLELVPWVGSSVGYGLIVATSYNVGSFTSVASALHRLTFSGRVCVFDVGVG